MKFHKPIQLSALRTPQLKGRAPYTVDYLQGFWLRLYWDTMIGFSKIACSPGSRPQIKALNIVRGLSFKRAAYSLAGVWLMFALLLWPRAGATVYADPIAPAPTFKVIKPLPLLEEPLIKAQDVLETVYVSPLKPSGTFANTYDPGQCTWYAASRLPVPSNWGNAINWGYAAMAAGYTVSDVPKPGAVAWSVSDSYLGHVAVVEDDGVTISEMNYNGPYSVDSRIPNPGEFRYIYL